MTPAGHPARPATDQREILLTILAAALILIVVAGGCSTTRKPGQSWPWVAESQTVADEFGTLTTIGVGVRL